MGETVAKRSGLETAIEQTVRIASHLNTKSDKALREKLIYSIFDDQLKAHTTFNRQQRHNAKKLLKKALRKQESE